MPPELIYCADGNPRFANEAIKYGYTYGSQMPRDVYFMPEFIDQNWKNPKFEKYIKSAKKYKPRLASVIDLEKWNQLPRVIWWASCISPYITEAVIIIPKVNKIIQFLPKTINNTKIRLGYSVPTKYGKTEVPYEEFKGWDIHLLGGSPKNQLKAYKGLHEHGAKVVSIDGNYMAMKARRFCQYFDGVRWVPDNKKTKENAPLECFKRSCKNIKTFWENNYDI